MALSLPPFLCSRRLKCGATRFFWHGTQLVPALVSHHINGLIIDTISFLRSRWCKWGATWLCHVTQYVPVSSIASLHSLGQDDKNEVQYDFTNHVMTLVMASMSCDTNTNCSIVFLMSRELKWVQYNFLVMWHHQCWHQNHVIPRLSSMAPLHSLGEDYQNGLQHDFFHHVTLLAPVSFDTDDIINGNIAFLRSWFFKWGVT